jgi:hypothetical protein
VARAHDPRREVYVDADVALIGHDRLAGVDADPHAYRPAGERGLNVAGGGDRAPRVRERDEKGIALGVHVEPAVPGERLTQHAVVLGQHVRVALAQLAQQERGALDVGKEKRDRAARKPAHGHMIAPDRAAGHAMANGSRAHANPERSCTSARPNQGDP